MTQPAIEVQLEWTWVVWRLTCEEMNILQIIARISQNPLPKIHLKLWWFEIILLSTMYLLTVQVKSKTWSAFLSFSSSSTQMFGLRGLFPCCEHLFSACLMQRPRCMFVCVASGSGLRWARRCPVKICGRKGQVDYLAGGNWAERKLPFAVEQKAIPKKTSQIEH